MYLHEYEVEDQSIEDLETDLGILRRELIYLQKMKAWIPATFTRQWEIIKTQKRILQFETELFERSLLR